MSIETAVRLHFRHQVCLFPYSLKSHQQAIKFILWKLQESLNSKGVSSSFNKDLTSTSSIPNGPNCERLNLHVKRLKNVKIPHITEGI